jgi:hypothetical protein
MIATLWRKHWIELRGRWLWLTAVATLPGIVGVVEAVGHQRPLRGTADGLFGTVALILVALLPAQFAGTGVTTAMGRRPQRATDPSLLFTLSLPVRRRMFLLYRASFGLLALATAAALALVINALVFPPVLSAVAPWQALTYGLWILLALLPLYFLDTLLSIRFTEIAVMQIQAFCIAGMVVALDLAGLLPRIYVTAFHHLTLHAIVPPAIGACLISAALAALTVWSLERQDF